MNLQTEIDIEKAAFGLGYNDRIISIGSCFADNIGNYLNSCRFSINVNPCGIVYNPISTLNVIEQIDNNIVFDKECIVESQGLYHSLFHHGSFSSETEEQTLCNINSTVNKNHIFWKDCNTLLITFGTAWVYRHIPTDIIASNCHKLPSSQFERIKLDCNKITDIWIEEIEKLKLSKPNLKIIFTVSPIRHWKDGAHGNQLSKATLLLAIDNLIHEFQNVEYFPAYEIMMDQLRDYRFYADDMLHPSNMAIEYIRNRFCEHYMDSDTIQLMKRVERFNQALAHRALHPESPEWQKHLQFIAREESALDKIFKSHD